jgi:hypothetical protein
MFEHTPRADGLMMAVETRDRQRGIGPIIADAVGAPDSQRGPYRILVAGLVTPVRAISTQKLGA